MFTEEQRRDNGKQYRRRRNDGRVDARKTCNKILDAGLLAARVFDKFQDAGYRGIFESLGHLHLESGTSIHATANDVAPDRDSPRHGFARERRGIHQRFSLDHNTVQGNALSGLHHDDVADFHLVRVHLDKRPVAFHVRIFGANIHHGTDGLAGLAYRIPLEKFPHLVKQHDRHRFRELVNPEGGHRRDHHEEVLVKDLATPDVLERLAEYVVAHNQVGDCIQAEPKNPVVA